MKLLDATLVCIAELGYTATSTNDIVRRAGVSRGALAHHFPTKAELIAEAARRMVDKRLVVFRERFGALEPGGRTLAAALELMWGFYSEPECAALIALKVAACHELELRATMAALHEEYLGFIVSCHVEFFPDLPLSPQVVLTMKAVIALYGGLALSALTGETARHEADAIRAAAVPQLLAMAFQPSPETFESTTERRLL